MGNRSLCLPLVLTQPFLYVTMTCLRCRQLLYNVSIGVCGFAVASEIGSLPLRSHTQALIGVTQVSSGWIIIFTIPYIINPDAGNLGGKIGYMFFGLGIIVTILLYFYCPETKGLTYDEVPVSMHVLVLTSRLIICFRRRLVREGFKRLLRVTGRSKPGMRLVPGEMEKKNNWVL